jgi:hypothetical protein
MPNPTCIETALARLAKVVVQRKALAHLSEWGAAEHIEWTYVQASEIEAAFRNYEKTKSVRSRYLFAEAFKLLDSMESDIPMLLRRLPCSPIH